jgi:Prp8 binding protein
MSVSIYAASSVWVGPAANTVQLQGHTEPVYSCSFNPNGDLLATGGADRRIFIWAPEREGGPTSKAVLSQHHSGPITHCTFSYDGAQIVSASADKTVSLWDVEQANHIRRFRGHAK